MKPWVRFRTGAAAVLILAVVGALAAQEQKPPKDYKDLDLGDHAVKPVAPKKDEKTGFVVGGKNDTALIKRLTEINGRTIAELEKDMRPGAKSKVGSTQGFLGPDEKLLDVLAMDNKTVVEELGLTHQELAKHLHTLAAIGFWQSKHKQGEAEFVYHGRRFKVRILATAGTQPSPFYDGTGSGANATVYNLDTGKKLGYALLVPHMIERYGFYEGKGTPYRVDPREVIEVLDFLKKRPKE